MNCVTLSENQNYLKTEGWKKQIYKVKYNEVLEPSKRTHYTYNSFFIFIFSSFCEILNLNVHRLIFPYIVYGCNQTM